MALAARRNGPVPRAAPPRSVYRTTVGAVWKLDSVRVSSSMTSHGTRPTSRSDVSASIRSWSTRRAPVWTLDTTPRCSSS